MLAPPDATATTATQASVVHPAHLVPLETTARPVLLATRVQPVQLASAVSAPNTAPSTVVSSSKTEPADKRQLPEDQGRRVQSFACESVSSFPEPNCVLSQSAIYSMAWSGALFAALLTAHTKPDSIFR